MPEINPPYYLRETPNGNISIQLKHTIYYPRPLPAKGVNVNFFEDFRTYDSIDSLFLHLLYSAADSPLVSNEIKERILSRLEQFYVLDVDAGHSEIPLQQRYLVLQRCEKELSYNATSQKPLLAQSVDAHFKSAQGKPVSYEETLSIFRISKEIISPSVVTSLLFPTLDDILVWTFERLISYNIKILKCKYCQQFFVHSGKTRQFCSSDCAKKYNQNDYYFHNSHIESTMKQIYSAFSRKKESPQSYIYVGIEPEDAYDPAWMFSHQGLAPKKQWPNRLCVPYQKDDFSLIHESYKQLLKTKHHELARATYAFQNETLSAEKYTEAVEDFVFWLTMVRKQLKAFEITKD